jgi:pimeloyl-ACP methyl ester carboxylesterase
MEDWLEYCPAGVRVEEEWIGVSKSVSLRVITFRPKPKGNNPAVLFVAGWITQIKAWKSVLREMTKDFPVYYVETREKISARVRGAADYGVEAIGRDLVTLVRHFELRDKRYILFGSSLGATAILDCCRSLESAPLCLVLIGPNAVFRVPRFGLAFIRIFPPFLYTVFKPVVKWYLRTFRLDVKSDYAQYEKYCQALDAADPGKLKRATLSLSKYRVWDLLEDIEFPCLIVGASRDVLHEPENLQKMVSLMKSADYLDLETNRRTHSGEMVEEMRQYLGSLP